MSEESGISFFGFLALLFIGLKLTDHIHWSWLWVLSPIWIPFMIFIVVVLGLLLGHIISTRRRY